MNLPAVPVAVLLAVLVALPGCLREAFGPDATTPRDYLRGGGTWIIEVDHVAGRDPTPAAFDAVKSRVAPLVDKESVQVHRGTAPVAGGGPWTVDKILDLHRATQDEKNGDGRVVTHVLYLDGRFRDDGQDTNALGVTIGHDVIAIFDAAIDDACSPLNACFFNEVEIEKAVLIHEFGHALGLVNRGVAMVQDHEDEQHEGHSDNPDSVMFWQVETAGGILGLSSIPTEFDANDRRDLCAVSGRC